MSWLQPISYPTRANGIIVLLNSDLEIIAKFYRFLILQNDRKLMWQKEQQVGNHMACAACKLQWKIWKRRKLVCWTKIAVIYNLKNVYQTKDNQPWLENLKCSSLSRRELRVIIVHLHIAVVKMLRKTLIAMWQTLSRSKLFSTRTLSAFP